MCLTIFPLLLQIELLFPYKLYLVPHCSLSRSHATPTTEPLDAYRNFLFPRYDQFSVREKIDSLASLLRLQSFWLPTIPFNVLIQVYTKISCLLH